MSITIKEALQRASFQLRDQGFDRPRREAQFLLTALLGCDAAWLYAHDQEKLTAPQWAEFQAWLARRATGEPFAYLAGQKEFMGLCFAVTPDVLIPRPETEFLVEAVAEELQAHTSPRILEIGAGSGAVAVSLAKLLPKARVVAVDVSQAALEIAQKNAARHGVAGRVEFLAGDLYAPVADEYFDAVVSNPPYISAADILKLQCDVKDFEPRLALCGGEDGLDFYRRLTGELDVLSNRPKMLAFEVGMGQAQAVAALCLKAGYENTRQIKDLAGIDRIITAKLA
ncbi:peptide chain release factor N(5)-glutamine methyltransferase [Dethiobacter alkaliphilus]|uniref:Release factor glutamine methyltransferase n=1 Tax=Dethiobacter alkaliphilus AHT 1 TaxID=555088 RepID=C0GGF2_DETAL|nr:peptide chain release factor N(5)-glutamine methyltransferase [Dethiobacter alkaliphilus]EEG77582.1 protein-(glutamine-N5) methyltransferase, release factor-specific [Dethiobacter alkaliphilus AHT 1]